MKFLLSLAVAAVAFAQGAPPQPNLSALTTQLGLTEAQVQSLRQVQQQERAALETAMQSLHENQQALHTLLDKGGADAATVGKMVLDLTAARKQIDTTRSGFNDQARNVLTADQKTKLKALQDAAGLMPAMEQAMMLGLLDPPAGARGRGFGFGGPEGIGPGGPAREGIRGRMPPQGFGSRR